jgi:hypothetical protein
MADVMATNFRYIKVAKKGTGGEPDQLQRVRLRAGQPLPSDMPAEVKRELKKAGLLIDEKRITAEGARIPPGYPDRQDLPSEQE